MNLTQMIEETGKRHAEKLTNADIKEVLEIALNVAEQGFQRDRRIEIQDFGVLEIIEREVKAGGRLGPFGSREPI